MYLEGEIGALSGGAARRSEQSIGAERCAACPARANAICAGLDAEALRKFHGISRHRVLRKGQALTWQGDAVSTAATVISGTLKLSSATADGREQILGLLGPGGFIGRTRQARSRYDVVALADTELCQFLSNALAEFAHDHPAVAEALLDKTTQELDRARHWLLMLGRASAAERVATLLIDFAGTDLATGSTHPFPLSRGQMADVCGLTIETVSRQLTALKRAGVIALPERSRFTVRDAQALEALAGFPPATASH